MLTVRHTPSNFEETIAGAFAGVQQGVSPEGNVLPTMTTPTVAAATTPEDIALATAAVNASTAALNYAAATRK